VACGDHECEKTGTVAEIEERQSRSGTDYSVVFTYKVDREWYGGTFTTGEAYRKGDTIAVLYDPSKPERNNLVQQETIRKWIIAAVLCALGLLLLVVALH
jgi:hypothetical protein